MSPSNRHDDDEQEEYDSREMEKDRDQIRRMLWQAVEKLTKKVETLEISVAVIVSESEALKKLSGEFAALAKDYAKMEGHMKLQGKIFGWIAGLLLAVIAGLIVALVKKP